MGKYIFTLMLLCLVSNGLHAQLWQTRRWEVAAGIGTSQVFGDVGGFSPDENILGIRDMSIRQSRFNVNLNGKYRILRNLNARVSLTTGFFHSSDIRGSNVRRGFESSTSYFEPLALVEYYFIKNKAENNYLFLKNSGRYISSLIKSLDVYAFSGGGANFYNVTGNEALEERGTLGKGNSVILPVGLGASFVFSPDLNFGVEVCGRYAFTDFLDGYSSQYSQSKDVYYTVNITAIYKIKVSPKNSGPYSFR